MTLTPTAGTDAPGSEVVLLSTEFRQATERQHRRAESVPFVTALMSGAATRDHYIALLEQYAVIYAALEDVGDALVTRSEVDPFGAALVFDELRRSTAILHDLSMLTDEREPEPLVPATAVYADRVRELSPWAAGYAAHAYTRYLGDLSGGQVMRRAVHQHYGFTEQQLTFFSFPEIPKVKPFKDAFRSRLDALQLSASDRASAVAEAQHAFDLNTAVFTELHAKFSRRHQARPT